jgi:hypothetical protein
MNGVTLYTVSEFAKANQHAFTEPALRWQIFRASENGLEAAGAIRRVGRRVYIVGERYMAWLDSQGASTKA